MTEMFGEAWSPMSVPDLAPDDDDDDDQRDGLTLCTRETGLNHRIRETGLNLPIGEP